MKTLIIKDEAYLNTNALRSLDTYNNIEFLTPVTHNYSP